MNKVVLIASLCIISLLVSCSSSKPTPKFEFTHAPEVSSNDAAMPRCRVLYEQTCQHCHKLPVPEKYSMEKWNKIMPIMASKSKIDQLTSDSIFKYVQAARPVELQAVPNK